MNPEMTRLFKGANIWLWTLIVTALVLYGGQQFGLDWGLAPNKAFGRFLQQTDVAMLEFSLAILLLGIQIIAISRPNWVVVTIGCGVAGVAIFHMYNYLIGTEFLLLWASASLIREYARKS